MEFFREKAGGKPLCRGGFTRELLRLKTSLELIRNLEIAGSRAGCVGGTSGGALPPERYRPVQSFLSPKASHSTAAATDRKKSISMLCIPERYDFYCMEESRVNRKLHGGRRLRLSRPITA